MCWECVRQRVYFEGDDTRGLEFQLMNLLSLGSFGGILEG